LLGLAPTLHLPSVVLEIIAGIVIGPAILGLVEVDLPLEVLALLGLAFLLFLAGLEIDLETLRGGRELAPTSSSSGLLYRPQPSS
jgi:Kef-type K+ transport system membrane component KefB